MLVYMKDYFNESEGRDLYDIILLGNTRDVRHVLIKNKTNHVNILLWDNFMMI